MYAASMPRFILTLIHEKNFARVSNVVMAGKATQALAARTPASRTFHSLAASTPSAFFSPFHHELYCHDILFVRVGFALPVVLFVIVCVQ